jgi:ureidoacrylate peracid hydrolase
MGAAGAAAVSGAAEARQAGPSLGSRQVPIEARPEPISIDLGKTAVLVIDMQNDFGAEGGMFERAGIDVSGIRAVVPNVRAALAAARSASLPVISEDGIQTGPVRCRARYRAEPPEACSLACG